MQYTIVYTTAGDNVGNIPASCVSTLCNSWTYVKNCDKLEISKRIKTLAARYTYVYLYLWIRQINKQGSGIYSF